MVHSYRRKRGFELIQDVAAVEGVRKKDRRGWKIVERVTKVRILGSRKRAERLAAAAAARKSPVLEPVPLPAVIGSDAFHPGVEVDPEHVVPPRMVRSPLPSLRARC